jgi:hypothetical protein
MMRSLRGVKFVGLFGVIALTVALATSAARSAEVTRESFREAAEPICKVDTEANERILAGVRAEVRSGKLRPPAIKFSKAATALSKALSQLESLPRPPADEARLSKWFGTVKLAVGYFEAESRKLKAGQKSAAEGLVKKLTLTASKANAQVLPFEFTYCRLEPSRFT